MRSTCLETKLIMTVEVNNPVEFGPEECGVRKRTSSYNRVAAVFSLASALVV
jgi:hypothetical protein